MPPGLDLDRLQAHLDTELPGLRTGPLTAELISGGRSNLTYGCSDGTHHWVVRRPPLGDVLPTAHDMAREYQVIGALYDSPVPVPRPVLYCADPAVTGAPFYLMDRVDGEAIRDAGRLAARGPRRAGALGRALVDTLALLHSVDPEDVGLASLGRPEGFLARQVRRFGRQLDACRGRDLPGIEELRTALGRSVPTQGAPALVHGDYRLDNTLVDDADRITAVLDWELATLGDPLTDLALLLVFRGQGPGAAAEPRFSDCSDVPGFPDAHELLARYTAATGRDTSALGWYVALACFKLAVMLEAIHQRHVRGGTVGGGFDHLGPRVPGLVARGLAALRA